MEQVQNHTATFESVWAEIQKNRLVPEVVSEKEAEYNRNIMKVQSYRYYIDEDDGSLCFDGIFIEEYFLTAFRYGNTTFFGEKFDNITLKVRGLKDGYDIVFCNDASVALIEVKSKADMDDVPKVLKKADTFRIQFPYYKDHRVYLGLASMSFDKELEDDCEKQGIAIIKQVGDTVVINDEHLKVF